MLLYNLFFGKILTISGDVVVGKLSVEPGASFNATCAMKGSVKELNSIDDQKRHAEKTA